MKAWRKCDSDSNFLWATLNEKNNLVKAGLESLRKRDANVAGVEGQLQKDFHEVRRKLKSMGNAAGVGIEPEAQTGLCDATMDLDGVIMCGVPGAGGNDAVFAIYRGGEPHGGESSHFGVTGGRYTISSSV